MIVAIQECMWRMHLGQNDPILTNSFLHPCTMPTQGSLDIHTGGFSDRTYTSLDPLTPTVTPHNPGGKHTQHRVPLERSHLSFNKSPVIHKRCKYTTEPQGDAFEVKMVLNMHYLFRNCHCHKVMPPTWL